MTSTDYLLDVTDVTNVKVKFIAVGGGLTQGDSSVNFSTVTFIKCGDT